MFAFNSQTTGMYPLNTRILGEKVSIPENTSKSFTPSACGQMQKQEQGSQEGYAPL